MNYKWTFDEKHQQLIPSYRLAERIGVKQIATMLYDRVINHFDLTGPWAGWRVRGHILKGPGGEIYTPEMLKKQVWQKGIRLEDG